MSNMFRRETEFRGEARITRNNEPFQYKKPEYINPPLSGLFEAHLYFDGNNQPFYEDLSIEMAKLDANFAFPERHLVDELFQRFIANRDFSQIEDNYLRRALEVYSNEQRLKRPEDKTFLFLPGTWQRGRIGIVRFSLATPWEENPAVVRFKRDLHHEQLRPLLALLAEERKKRPDYWPETVDRFPSEQES